MPSQSHDEATVTAADVAAAAARIADGIVATPTSASLGLSRLTGADVVVKFENLQYTGSFKERGALNRLLLLDPTAERCGVVAASAGNHAQAVAYHAQRLGIPATIVMPEQTPFVKVARTRDLGATVVQRGGVLADSYRFARDLAAREGATFISPYDDDAVIAGQGTVALEMLAAFPDLDVLVVPAGGGGLLAGMAVAAKHTRPAITVVGVQAERCDALVSAVRGRTFDGPADTVAEGIAVTEPGAITVPLVRSFVDDLLTVTEVRIEEAIGLYLDVEKVVAEGAGAATLAALLQHPDRFRGRRVGLVLSGGNIDLRLLGDVITRALVRSGRLVHLAVDLRDVPGSLARLTATVARIGANIVEVSHRRDLPAIQLRVAQVDLTVETRDRAHVDELVAGLTAEGFDVTERTGA